MPSTFNRSEILAAAHWSARIYKSEGGYRAAFVEGLRNAWKEAKLQAEIDARRTRPVTPAMEAIDDEIRIIHLKDSLGSADFARLTELHAAASVLRKAA